MKSLESTRASGQLTASDIPEQVWRIVLDLRAKHRGVGLTFPAFHYDQGVQWDVFDNYPVITIQRCSNHMDAERARSEQHQLEMALSIQANRINSLNERRRTLAVSTDRQSERLTAETVAEIDEAQAEVKALENQLSAAKERTVGRYERLTIGFNDPLTIGLPQGSS